MSTLNEEILRLEQAKAKIDEILIARGVSVPFNATLDIYHNLINSIKGGTSSEEVTATKANVLIGTTTITADSNDEIVEGTMPNYSGTQQDTDGVWIGNGYINMSVKNPGYYAGNSDLRAAASDFGNATQANVLGGQTFTSSNGIKLSGTMPTPLNSSNITLTTSDTRKVVVGKNDIDGVGGSWVVSNSDGVSRFCTALQTSGYYDAGSIVGAPIVNNGAVAPSALGAGGSYTIPAGYHNGSGKVTVQSLATMTASGDATAAEILSGKKAYVDGTLLTGTMPNYHTNAATASGQNSYGVYYYFSPGYYNYNNENPWIYRPLSDFGNATAAQVLSGKTFTSSAGKLVTGTLAVQSVITFNAAPGSSATQITFTWKNPAKGAFSGVIIVGKTGSTPTSISDGTRYYKGSGNNTSPSGTSSTTVSGFSANTTYYFRAFAYAVKSNAEWVGGSLTASTTTKKQGSQTFTSSGTFTVPAGVTSIDIFCVGGGGAAGGYLVSSRGGGAYTSGAGGGYTATKKAYAVTPGATFAVTIGAGGVPSKASYALHGTAAPTGGTTSFGSVVSATGGKGSCYKYSGGSASVTQAMDTGGAGGSGGGGCGGADAGENAGAGGSNGSNGVNGWDGYWTCAGGKGQGTTTRAFGESSGTLYAGGGGGGAYGNAKRGAGGDGGGGAGKGYGSAGGNGTANTGGGGGGCATLTSGATNKLGGSGGSGICIVRWGY